MTDGERGRVFHGEGDNFFGSALHGLGDNPENPVNPDGFAFNAPMPIAKVSVRKLHSSGQWYALYFHGRDMEGEIVEIVYRTDSGTDEKNGNSYTIFIGGGATDYNDGEWHDHELDLAGDMDVLRGTDPPLGIVNAFAVAQDEMDLLVDGFMLTEAAIEEHYWRTYQVVPGAGLGGVLGTYDSVTGDASWHHYNDLGTLIATTDDAGEGEWKLPKHKYQNGGRCPYGRTRVWFGGSGAGGAFHLVNERHERMIRPAGSMRGELQESELQGRWAENRAPGRKDRKIRTGYARSAFSISAMRQKSGSGRSADRRLRPPGVVSYPAALTDPASPPGSRRCP